MAAKMQSPEAQARYEAFQDASSRMRDLVRKQEQLTSSKTECEMVAGELSQLKAEEPVYKLMGKVLVLQDPADAKANVTQRLQMIDRELCVC
jgi:prefoldin beta subunit